MAFRPVSVACYRAKQCSSYLVDYCGENALKSRRFMCYRSRPLWKASARLTGSNLP
jgi:hypothetical protein